MNGKQFAGSTYIEHAKYYEKEYQKHHQKQEQKHYQKQYQEHKQTMASHQKPTQWAPNPFNSSTESASSNTNETPLTESELDYFFWKTLVPLGWRKSRGQKLAESYQLMLVCDACDKSVLSQQSHTITLNKAKKMSDPTYLQVEKQEHKTKCKPLEYDENGDVVEAVPEATPSIFEKPQTGTVRLDTINNVMMVFDGERWIESL